MSKQREGALRAEVDAERKTIAVPVRLVSNMGKTRIKRRISWKEYGRTAILSQEVLGVEHYAEWMIGYDVVKKKFGQKGYDKFSLTTLPAVEFVGANGKRKVLYELSEYVWYFYQWGVIQQEQLDAIDKWLAKLPEDALLSNNPRLQIKRGDFVPEVINGTEFQRANVQYPLLVREFEGSEIICEIKISEQQYAMGTQPLLCVCLPLSELITESPILGRRAKSKELAKFLVTEGNVGIFLEILEIFGTLSESHRYDVREILKAIKETQQA